MYAGQGLFVAGKMQVARKALAAACFRCGWTDDDEKTTRLAVEEKLYCGKCQGQAKVVYTGCWPSLVAGRPEIVGLEGVSEAVHEGMARSSEGAR